jgi:type VI secretion system secreted protein Hcp
MSGHAYLTFFDDAPGESTAVGHEGWIELLSWSWGVTATTSPSIGPGGGFSGGAGRPDPSALVWEHAFDAASTRLIGFAASGKHLAKAELHVTRGGGAGGRDAWLTVLMEDLVITSVATSGSADGEVEQTVGMEFRAVKFGYRRQRPDGSLDAPATVSWNIATGAVVSAP